MQKVDKREKVGFGSISLCVQNKVENTQSLPIHLVPALALRGGHSGAKPKMLCNEYFTALFRKRMEPSF